MENKKKKILIITILLILIISIIYLVYPKKEQKIDVDIERNNNITNPINYKEEIDKLKQQYNNNDIVGILSFENTDYTSPIMQGLDNDYYLNHTPDKKENYMGSIYLDYRVDIDSSKKLLIFGHNSSNVDMPFKILENYYDEEYYHNHKHIYITTNTTKKEYEIFSVHIETTDFTYMNINFTNDEEYLNHINKLKEKSMYNSNLELTKDDEILLMQTCSTHKDYQNYDKKYLLIIAKRIYN